MSSDPTQAVHANTSNPPTSQQSIISNQTTDTQSVVNNNGTDPNKAAEGPVFYKIIDVVSEWQRGNFLPALHCLRYNLIQKEYLDNTGYNMLHHSVSQGSVPITLILLDYFKIDVNIKSGNNQTPLMIASNYGLVDIIRILVERGALINEQDDTKFSALLYSVKQGRIPQFAYLIHQKADIHVRDSNGCSAVHWAAYKNNVFILKVLNRLGLDLNCVDYTGLTPIDRAAQSGAFEAVQYLLEAGDGKKPANMKYDQIASDDIKEILRRKYFPTRSQQLKEKYTEIVKQNSQIITAGTYGLLWLIMMAMFFQVIMHLVQTFDLIFFLISLFSISYSLWYYLKSHGTPNKTKVFAYESLHVSNLNDSVNVSLSKPQVAPKMNFEALDHLVKGENKGSVIHEGQSEEYPSFLHELAALFEMKNYKEIARFNEKDNCPTCLIRRPPRSGHCQEIGACVPNFQHYSPCLGTAIKDTDHHFYLLLLLLQQFVLTLFIGGLWVSYADDLDKHKLIFVIYMGNILWNKFGFIYTVSYAIFVTLWTFNTVFLWIELYGVVKNETYYEMFDRANCTYLFRVKQDKKKGFVKSFKNPYNHGYVNNLKQYFGKVFHFDMEVPH